MVYIVQEVNMDMSSYTRVGLCALGTIWSHDYSELVIVITETGEALGANEDDGFTRFWFDADSLALIDGDTGRAYEVL